MNFLSRVTLPRLPCDRLKEMGFAKADVGMDKKRVEANRRAVIFGNGTRCRIGHAVGFAFNKVGKRMTRIKRRTGEAGFLFNNAFVVAKTRRRLLGKKC